MYELRSVKTEVSTVKYEVLIVKVWGMNYEVKKMKGKV